MSNTRMTAIGLAGLLTSGASAIVVDGIVDLDYGAAIAVQTVETGFGDNASEWNAVYATVDGDRLYVMVTGNIEANFNKLEIFIDSHGGGENVLSGIPRYDFFADPNWISANLNNMTFDTGFDCDYHMFARAGFGNFEVDFIDRLGAAGTIVNGNTGSAPYAGAIGDSVVGTTDPGSIANGETVNNHLTQQIEWAMDNSNEAGIGGANGAEADQEAALAVGTGFEFSIHLDDLNVDGDEIRLAIMQGNGDHNYLANQNFMGLPIGTGNLGGDGAGGFIGDLSGIDFNNFAGEQFIRVPLVVDPPCDGDVDGNDIVDFDDVLTMLVNWGPCAGCPGDVNGDDEINFGDLLIALSNWGPC